MFLNGGVYPDVSKLFSSRTQRVIIIIRLLQAKDFGKPATNMFTSCKKEKHQNGDKIIVFTRNLTK